MINLKRRPDRLQAVQQEMRYKGWPFPKPTIVAAVDGSKVGVPYGWVVGEGAWGCLETWRGVLRKAIMDDVKSILCFEDDITFSNDIASRVKTFLATVPDWDCLFFGGQHMIPPTPVSEGIVKCNGTTRTHAFALRGRMINDLYKKWSSRESWGHCDHTLAHFSASYKTYAPTPFIIGQVGGMSDICNGKTTTNYWG
jgi:hypothetical protein